MKRKKVLLVGICGDAANRFYLPHLLTEHVAGRIELTGCDVMDGSRDVAPLTFIQCPDDWTQWQGASADKILAREWDLVFIVTPPQFHCQVAQVIAASQIRLGHICHIIIEKPVDTNPGRTNGLATWLQTTDPDRLVGLHVLDHYAYGKWAINEIVRRQSELELVTLEKAYFVSYERTPMWPSKAFEEGYLLEHGAGHAPASLDRVVGGIAKLDLGNFLIGGKYIGPALIGESLHLRVPTPTQYDTWARADFVVDTFRPQAFQVPFVIAVGKGVDVERNEKWLRLDGKTPAGLRLTIWADIDRKKLYCAANGDARLVAESTKRDGYGVILPEVLSGDSRRIAQVTVPFDKAAGWLVPFSKAATHIRSALIPYPLGGWPTGAREILAETKAGLPNT
jgi:hypothetical protein